MAEDTIYIEDTVKGSAYTYAQGGLYGDFWVQLQNKGKVADEVLLFPILRMDNVGKIQETIKTIGTGTVKLDNQGLVSDDLYLEHILHLLNQGLVSDEVTLEPLLIIEDTVKGSAEISIAESVISEAKGKVGDLVTMHPVIKLANVGKVSDEVTITEVDTEYDAEWEKESIDETEWEKL